MDIAAEVKQATSARMADHKKSCALAKQLAERGIVVRTHHSGFYWVAVDDLTYFYREDPMGTGQTEVEAIEDLVEQLGEAS